MLSIVLQLTMLMMMKLKAKIERITMIMTIMKTFIDEDDGWVDGWVGRAQGNKQRNDCLVAMITISVDVTEDCYHNNNQNAERSSAWAKRMCRCVKEMIIRRQAHLFRMV